MKLIQFSIYIMLACSSINCRTRRIFRLLRVQSCPEYPDLPVMVTKFGRRHFDDETHVCNVTLKVKENLPDNLEAYFSLKKCDLVGTPDSCENIVQDLHVKNICEKIIMKNELWSSSIASLKPPVHCPVEADIYELNYKGKTDLFKFLPLPTGVWKAKGFLFGGTKMIHCIDTEVKIIERRISK